MATKKKPAKKPPAGRLRITWPELDPIATGGQANVRNKAQNLIKPLIHALCNDHDYDPRTLKFQIDLYERDEPGEPPPVDTGFLNDAQGLN